MESKDEEEINGLSTAYDSNCDGLSDGDEIDMNLNPLAPDSDSDGLPDGFEYDFFAEYLNTNFG